MQEVNQDETVCDGRNGSLQLLFWTLGYEEKLSEIFWIPDFIIFNLAF